MTTPRPLRVLVIGNFSVAPCGIRNFADMTLGGLRAHGVSADPWDATYDLIYRRREASQPTYLPDDWAAYDVVHLNWHPIALNTYGAGHFPWPKGTRPIVSVYLNDVPPWSGCPVAERADVLIAPEPAEGIALELVYPIPDWIDRLPPPSEEFSVGLSGVRGDGHEAVREICAAHGWRVNATPAGWAPVETEIRRLATSSINVCWYHQQRGIAGTPSVMLATRRPLLLNDSQMFRPWQTGKGYSVELYLPASHTNLERGLIAIHDDWQRGRLRLPGPHVYRDHAWATAAARLTTVWSTALEAACS